MSCPRCPRDNPAEIITYFWNRPEIKIRYMCSNGHRWVVYGQPLPGERCYMKIFECRGLRKFICVLRWSNPWDSCLDHVCGVNRPVNVADTVSVTPTATNI